MRHVILEAVIAEGEDLSGSLHINGSIISLLEMPAEWTEAALTFQASMDGENFSDLYDSENTEVSKAVEAGRTYMLPFGSHQPFVWLKIRSGTSETPVDQEAGRTIKLFVWGD
jgi:hypothetical protein